MQLPKRSLVVIASAASMLLMSAASGAGSLKTYEHTVKDRGDRPASADITKVELRSQTSQEPATVHVRFRGEPDYRDTITVWFNTDGDKAPDMRMDAAPGGAYIVRKSNGWGYRGREITNHRCLGRVTMADASTLSMEFAPSCFGNRTWAVTAKFEDVTASGTRRVDFAPAPRTWSRRIADKMPTPQVP